MEKIKILEWKHGFSKKDKDNFGVKISTPNNGDITIAVNYELFFYFLKENIQPLYDDSDYDNFKDYFNYLDQKCNMSMMKYLQEYIDENVNDENVKQLVDFIDKY